MDKIKKGTHNGIFDWILENENHATYPENNSDMIRVLVQEHNKLIDELERQYQKGFMHGYSNGQEDEKINNIKNTLTYTVWRNKYFKNPENKTMYIGRLNGKEYSEEDLISIYKKAYKA